MLFFDQLGCWWSYEIVHRAGRKFGPYQINIFPISLGISLMMTSARAFVLLVGGRARAAMN